MLRLLYELSSKLLKAGYIGDHMGKGDSIGHYLGKYGTGLLRGMLGV